MAPLIVDMVDKDLTDDAADTIDRLLQLAQNGHRPSVDTVVEANQLAEALRDSGESDWDLPHEGQYVDDDDKVCPELKVVDVHAGTRADEWPVNEGKTVADYNPYHPDDAPVVEARYPGDDKTYSFPVTRLEW